MSQKPKFVGLYENALKKSNLSRKLIPLWSVLELKRAFLSYSAYQFIDDAPSAPNCWRDQGGDSATGTQALPVGKIIDDKVCRKHNQKDIANYHTLKDI